MTLPIIPIRLLQGGNGINSKVEIDDIFLLIDPRIRIDVTIFLEGVFQNGKMNTELTQIPLNHPYNVAPWNYSGSENVSAIPSNTVDWVLLELRDKLVP